MTILRTSLLDEIKDDKKLIPVGKLAYFQERQRNRLYDFLISKFLEKEKTGQFTRAHLARRIKKTPEQVTRWLSTPGNWTLDTISDLALGIFGGEIGFSIAPLEEGRRNLRQIDLLSPNKNVPYPTKTNIQTNFKLEGQTRAA